MEVASDLIKWQDEVDMAFIKSIQDEVTQSCALPFAVPIERIPDFILQAARWFWANCDWACEEKLFAIKNDDICKKCGPGNARIKLPPQILAVHGVYKSSDKTAYGNLGDFSVERMMMSTYSLFGGMGSIGGGFTGLGGNSLTGFNLADVVMSLYEVDTFDQLLNAPLTYDYNIHSHELIILGNLGHSNLIINCFKRCRIQDLYNNYYFFRLCVCFVKRSLGTIYGMYEFKLPGGVTINVSNYRDEANDEYEEIKEWIDSHNGVSYFFQPNTL